MGLDIKNAHISHLGHKMKFNEVIDSFFEGKTISKDCFSYTLVPLDNGKKDDIVIIKCYKRDETIETFYNDLSDAFISVKDLMSENWIINE